MLLEGSAGDDVALEALKDAIRHRRASFDDIRRAAKVCRVADVMRPYMELLAHRLGRPALARRG